MALSHPLSARFESLPLIICGPIVRRVELDSVTVWVALKEARNITISIYQGYKDGIASDLESTAIFTSDSHSSFEVGEHLHIGLVTLNMSDGMRLMPGTIYSYNLAFKQSSGDAAEDLKSLQLLEGDILLGFKQHQLPSFVTAPQKLEDLRIAHGSCRKPHGRGEDGLATLARIIESDFTDPERNTDPRIRPHYLFHTGDQIYADDVSDYLIELYNDAGNFLLQKIEQLPLPEDSEMDFSQQKDKPFVWFDATSDVFRPVRRATNFYSGFSGEEENHLYSFAEFCGAYLFQWCDVLWPKELPSGEDVFLSRELPSEKIDSRADQEPVRKYLIPFEDGFLEEKVEEREKERDEFVKESKNHLQRVKDFQNGLKAVRRALANMPSAMNFDDHDVTDDWYLTGRWSMRAQANMLGGTIIRNALMAFALFQAWGNNPKSWDEDSKASSQKEDDDNKARFAFLKSIPELISEFKDWKNPEEIKPEDTCSKQAPEWFGKYMPEFKEKLGFNNFENPPVKWHFSFQLGAAKVIVLDTRTRRDFSEGLDFPPNLIGEKALEDQIPDTSLPIGTDVFIIVSGAPVLGLAAMEAIGQPIVSRVLDVKNLFKTDIVAKKKKVEHRGHESLDIEAWSINEKGFEAFLKRCAPLKKVIFLSGDVHYGITSQMDYWKKGESTASRFVQMVSSAFKNEKPEGQLLGLLPASFTQVALTGGLNRDMAKLEFLAWENEDDIRGLKFRLQPEKGVFRDAKSTDFPLRYSYALGKTFLFISLRDWPLIEFTDPATGKKSFLPRLLFPKNLTDPDYRWRLTILSDDRPDNDRLKSLGEDFQLDPKIDVATDIKDSNYKNAIDGILKRSSFFTRSHLSRHVNWASHVGIVHFKKDGENFLANHSFFSFLDIPKKVVDNPGTFDQPFIRHEATLASSPFTDQPEVPKET